MAIRSARRILLCLRYGIGDLVMETPVFDALRAAVPGAHITALGARPAIDLLQQEPCLDALLAAQDFGFSHWTDQGDAGARETLREWYRSGDFDLVLDPSHAVAGVGAVLWEPPLPTILDAGQPLLTAALRRGAGGAEAVRGAIEEGWGLSVPDVPPRLHLGDAARAEARAWLIRNGMEDGQSLAALSPAASSPLKRWPVERLAAVGRHLAERGWRLLLLAGPGEQDLVQAMTDALPPGMTLAAGAGSLLQAAALLERCRVLVCNDTGLMHMAAAVGCPPVAVFGPTSPRIYAPRGAWAVGGGDPECLCRRHTEFGPPECIAAGRCRRADGPCVDQVRTRDVIAALERALVV